MRRTTPHALAAVPAALAAVTALASFALALPPGVSTFATGMQAVKALRFSAGGDLYVARRTPIGSITKCSPPSNAMTAVAGGFSDPVDLLFDGAGNLYVADYNYGAAGGAVRKVAPGGAITTFATVPNPVSLALDPSGDIYVGQWNGVIDRVTPGGAVSVYADLKTVLYLGVTGVNNHPIALVRDDDGTLYAAVTWGAIFKIAPGGASITGWARPMLGCLGLTKGPGGFLYASSYTFQEIWRIAPDGSGTLFAGKTNTAGFVDGPYQSARFNDPAGLVCSANGLDMYVADYGNSAIRGFDLTNPVEHGSWGRLKSLYR